MVGLDQILAGSVIIYMLGTTTIDMPQLNY